MKTIAFIPVRGGSKSIPLKNIKLFCGKPLVYWNLLALEQSTFVDEIVVATDADTIEQTIISFNFQKVSIYRRLPENASDIASSESVMLEYINHANLDNDICFMLVQATSPLTQTTHFDEALALFQQGKYDSILSCVRYKRFFWNENGKSLNYDYQKRPRRQDFDGIMMENGAFYINTVVNIIKSQNRLSGKIGIYEMPEYTATEIDEENDWIVLEQLMQKHVLIFSRSKKIKLFLTDVDGTLTDGGMYYSENGDELKKFNTRDGMGLQLLREAGVKVGIITSEITQIAKRRAKKLQLDYLVQGEKCGGKLAAVQAICEQENISLNEVAYIGDDINCYDLLNAVGIAACPSDAINKIKTIPYIHIMSKRGGEGCVREFADIINRK